MDFFNSKFIRQEYVFREKTDVISIFTSTDPIYITGGNVPNVTISYVECPGKHEYRLLEQGGMLSLEKKDTFSLLWLIYSPFLDDAIRVTVPQDFNGSIELHTKTGRTIISDLNSANISCESKSGAVKVTDVNVANNVNIGLSTGAATLMNANVNGNVEMNNSTGAVRLLKTSVGGCVNANNKTGSISLKELLAGGKISLNSTTGSIHGSIIGNESDYSIISNTRTGHNGLVNSRSGSKELNANTTTGSISISFIQG